MVCRCRSYRSTPVIAAATVATRSRWASRSSSTRIELRKVSSRRASARALGQSQSATEDLAYLRSLAEIPPGMAARITGLVQVWDWSAPPGAQPRFVGGVHVTATGEGRTFSTRANDRGEFAFSGLSLGKYELTAKPPDGYDSVPQTVEIHDPRGCGTTFVLLRYDGRVAGRVVDSTGTRFGACRWNSWRRRISTSRVAVVTIFEPGRQPMERSSCGTSRRASMCLASIRSVDSMVSSRSRGRSIRASGPSRGSQSRRCRRGSCAPPQLRRSGDHQARHSEWDRR